ncbi:MAG: FAD-dependent oxidoreductase [bacterium]
MAVISGAAPAATTFPPSVDADVLVIGGTPGGIAAAIGAARAGARVMLMEPGVTLGGVITTAWLTTFDMNLGEDGEHLTRGVFLEIYRQLGISFDPDEAARAFGRAVVSEPGVKAVTHAALVRLDMNGRRIVAAEFRDRLWRRTIVVRAKQVIDATDDGDVAAAAGVTFDLGRAAYLNRDRWMQAATLIFRVGGANWQRVAADIRARLDDGDSPALWGVNGRAAWGYADVMARYQPADPRVVAYPLNLALQHDGSILINALNVTGVNGLDPASVWEGMATARSELPHLVAYLRDAVPGFERARLLDHAPALYIRETRHIAGLYTLRVEDILAEEIFPDRIGVASYPIDIHPYHARWRNPYAPASTPYTLPFRAIVPRGTENLLLASPAFSATSEAHGSARVVPTVMALGQGAGVAAALCAQQGLTPHDIAADPALMRQVQWSLIGQGVYLGWKP